MASGDKRKSTKKKGVTPKPKRRITKKPSLLAAAGRTVKTTPRRRPTKKT